MWWVSNCLGNLSHPPPSRLLIYVFLRIFNISLPRFHFNYSRIQEKKIGANQLLHTKMQFNVKLFFKCATFPGDQWLVNNFSLKKKKRRLFPHRVKFTWVGHCRWPVGGHPHKKLVFMAQY